MHCAGQTTPWNSHLGSEEYESNARFIENFTGKTGDRYYDETSKFWGNDYSKSNPYYYDWTPEVQIKKDIAGNSCNLNKISNPDNVSMPLYTESTSVFWHKNINGFSYMTAVTQHPMRKQNTTSSNKESSIGTLGPIKFK